MKLQGKKLSGPSIKTIAIPRDGGDLIFKVQAVLDYEEFEKLDPAPEPPTVTKPGGEQSQDVRDSEYVERLSKWADRKTAYMVLKSLEATPDLEWETVNMSDPSTFENYQEEMKEAGITIGEITYILNKITEVCGLDQDKIDEATKSFLAGQEGQPKS